jgi:hypothetical protein
MDQIDHETATANPNSHPALSKFAFLIGDWRCRASLLNERGEWQTFSATWRGRYILSGYVIADEYCMAGPSGKLFVLGMNIRAYDAPQRTWRIKWLNALTGTWTDLGPKELGGIRFDGQSIVYVSKEAIFGYAYTRSTYANISANHFTWRGERSADGNGWTEFMVVEADRINQ